MCHLQPGGNASTRNRQDKNFQGFGRFATGSTGEYHFRTIKPVPYPGRPAPHIHVKVKKGGRELPTTQFMINGHPGNARDGIFRAGLDAIDRELILVDFKPVPGSKIGGPGGPGGPSGPGGFGGPPPEGFVPPGGGPGRGGPQPPPRGEPDQPNEE